MGEIADKVTEKNLDGNITEVLTNSAEYGVINQTEFFDHAVAKESNIAGYYVIAPGDFVYNPRISATAPVGPIRRNTLGIHGVMSPLYTVFRLTDAVDGTYLSHFFKTNGWHGFMKLEGNSGARSDRFSIGDATFFEMPIPVPSSSEQHAIGSFFSRLDDLITLHQRKYNKLLNVKKSMLEKMFPKNGSNIPEIRFKGFTDPWEQRKVFEIADRFDNLRVPVAANLRIPGNTPYYGANGIQDYVEGYTHDGEYILVAEDGASDLKTYPVNYVNGRIWVNNHAHVLQGKEKIANNKFLSYAMRLADIESVLVGGGRAKLNADIMMNLDIAIPSFNEQEQIGAYFSNLDNLITLHQRELEKLQNIKKYMLEKMFV